MINDVSDVDNIAGNDVYHNDDDDGMLKVS